MISVFRTVFASTEVLVAPIPAIINPRLTYAVLSFAILSERA